MSDGLCVTGPRAERTQDRWAQALDVVARAVAKMHAGALNHARHTERRDCDDPSLAAVRPLGFTDSCREARVFVSRPALVVWRDAAYVKAVSRLDAPLGRAPSRSEWRGLRPGGYPRGTSLSAASGGSWLGVLRAAGCSPISKQVALDEAQLRGKAASRSHEKGRS